MSCTSPALAGRFFYHSAAWEALTDSCVHAKSPQSCLILCDLWTLALQAPLSMGFSRQEYWSGFLYLPSEDLPNLGVKPKFLRSDALANRFLTSEPFEKPILREETVYHQKHLLAVQSNCAKILAYLD